jgi:hypothetical protein
MSLHVASKRQVGLGCGVGLECVDEACASMIHSVLTPGEVEEETSQPMLKGWEVGGLGLGLECAPERHWLRLFGSECGPLA